jgi:hypothetical protein
MMTLSITNSINVLYVILIHAECRYAGCHIAECRASVYTLAENSGQNSGNCDTRQSALRIILSYGVDELKAR